MELAFITKSAKINLVGGGGINYIIPRFVVGRMGVSVNWTLEEVLRNGFERVDAPGEAQMPGISRLLRFKAHGSFRLTDGLWHMFRLNDPVKAAARDAELNGPMLP